MKEKGALRDGEWGCVAGGSHAAQTPQRDDLNFRRCLFREPKVESASPPFSALDANPALVQIDEFLDRGQSHANSLRLDVLEPMEKLEDFLVIRTVDPDPVVFDEKFHTCSHHRSAHFNLRVRLVAHKFNGIGDQVLQKDEKLRLFKGELGKR